MNDALPSDVNAETRNRLPPVRPDALDEAGRRMYETAANDARSLVGVRTGPASILLHDPALYERWRPVNDFLRFEAGLDARLIEVAILATAREMDAHFEWHAHEAHGLKQGVPAATIEAIRRGAPLDGLPDDEAALIAIAREAIGAHRVRPETYANALRIFGATKVVDYTMLMGNYASVAILLETVDQRLPAGAVSALPAR